VPCPSFSMLWSRESHFSLAIAMAAQSPSYMLAAAAARVGGIVVLAPMFSSKTLCLQHCRGKGCLSRHQVARALGALSRRCRRVFGAGMTCGYTPNSGPGISRNTCRGSPVPSSPCKAIDDSTARLSSSPDRACRADVEWLSLANCRIHRIGISLKRFSKRSSAGWSIVVPRGAQAVQRSRSWRAGIECLGTGSRFQSRPGCAEKNTPLSSHRPPPHKIPHSDSTPTVACRDPS